MTMMNSFLLPNLCRFALALCLQSSSLSVKNMRDSEGHRDTFCKILNISVNFIHLMTNAVP